MQGQGLDEQTLDDAGQSTAAAALVVLVADDRHD
jgi:hypothetical protein